MKLNALNPITTAQTKLSIVILSGFTLLYYDDDDVKLLWYIQLYIIQQYLSYIYKTLSVLCIWIYTNIHVFNTPIAYTLKIYDIYNIII